MSVYSSYVLNPLVLVLLTFAVARMVVLLVSDKITEPIRTVIINRFGPEGWVTFGWHCTWCQGIWWSAIFTAITYEFAGPPMNLANAWLAILTFLAVAYGASYLADR